MARALGTDHTAVPCRPADIGADVSRCHPRTPSSPCCAPRRRRSSLRPGARRRLQGRADRRGRRRGVRRLRHLQGGQAPPLLRRAAAIAPAPAAVPAPLPLSAGAPGPVAELSQRLLRRRPRRRRRSAVLAPAALPHDGRRQSCSSPASCAKLARLRRARRSPRQPAGTTSPAGIRCRRRSISRPPISCPATSCRPRATASRWRTRSRAASRSSITALVEFAARIPPRLKLRGLREKHILREATARHPAAGASPIAPSSPIARRTAVILWRRARPPMSTGLLSGPAIAAAGLFRRRARSRSSSPKCRNVRRSRLPRQRGLRRHSVDPALGITAFMSEACACRNYPVIAAA